ncbi:MAG: glycosyltransferase family 4 protein [Coriobacteriia bacterium]
MMTGVNIIAEMLREIRPDAVHAHGPSLAVAALSAGYNPLWTIHGVLRQEAPLFKGAFNRLSFALAQYYEAIALRNVGRITGVSRYVVDAYSGRSRARWSVVENPADSSYFGLDREPQPGRVLVPAAIIPRKDQVSLVRAAAIIKQTIPNLSMHFAGSLSDTAYVQEVLQEIDRAGLADAVTLLGPLSADELREEYRSASLVALASRQESAPMAIIEAMAAGLPVVATDAGGVPDMIQDGANGFVVPRNDPGALAEKAAALLRDPARAAEFGAAAASQARSRFASARIAEQYLALYREIAGHRSPDKAMG